MEEEAMDTSEDAMIADWISDLAEHGQHAREDLANELMKKGSFSMSAVATITSQIQTSRAVLATDQQLNDIIEEALGAAIAYQSLLEHRKMLDQMSRES